jgi:hypothetical protein
MIVKLKCGFYYKIVKHHDKVDYDENFLNHLRYALNLNEKLSRNYTIESIDRMLEYGYVYDKDPANLVLMMGVEPFGDKIFRVFSRTFVHTTYRTNYWCLPDNDETVTLQTKRIAESCDFIFVSRQASNSGILKYIIKNSSLFNDWSVYREKIELKYKNNWQWIMYKSFQENTLNIINQLKFVEN